MITKVDKDVEEVESTCFINGMQKRAAALEKNSWHFLNW